MLKIYVKSTKCRNLGYFVKPSRKLCKLIGKKISYEPRFYVDCNLRKLLNNNKDKTTKMNKSGAQHIINL